MTSTVPSPGVLSPLRTLIRAVVTMPVFLVQHVRRRRHIHETRSTVTTLEEGPPSPARTSHSTDGVIQHRGEGVGPLVMRTYQVAIHDPALSARELMGELRADPNRFNSDLVAGFVIDDQPARDLTPEADLVVELPGPWNGPVRVAVANDTELVLTTLDGHMEAGHIRFDTVELDASDGAVGYRFRIRSWARAGDRAFLAVHLVAPVGKELQTAMWTAFCANAVTVAGGTRTGHIEVDTAILDDAAPSQSLSA